VHLWFGVSAAGDQPQSQLETDDNSKLNLEV